MKTMLDAQRKLRDKTYRGQCSNNDRARGTLTIWLSGVSKASVG